MNWCKIGLLLFLLVTILGIVNSLTVDENGGYSFVVAVEPSTPEPENLDEYLRIFGGTIGAFSINLYTSTDEYFFVKNVDLLLPITWTTGASVTESTTQTYEAADIRLSKTTIPFVESINPTCGLAGNFIELPATFLDRSKPQIYGEPSKTLVNLWARYRFGVWEEHGDPGNKQFPYFYQNSTSSEWEVTSCSDHKLDGKRTDKNQAPCGEDGEINPSNDCRFRPSPISTATTSLMGFHWLNSITQFCDENTHNRIAPNRQNLFCGYQSIWSVIRKTEDFGKVIIKKDGVPSVKVNVLKPRVKPALYLLLDRGATTKNTQAGIIIANVIRSFVPFFADELLKDTIVSVGSFTPSESTGTIVENHISWVKVGENLDEIYKAIASHPVNPVQGDFGIAIESAANYIEALNPVGGSALLVVKTGSGQGLFESLIYEEDLLFSLKKNRIALFAAELQNTEDNFPTHLAKLTAYTNGKHVSLKSASSTEADMNGLFTTVKATLAGTVLASPEKLLQRRQLVPDQSPSKNVVLMESLESLQIYLTVPKDSTVTAITMNGETMALAPTLPEWGETVNNASRSTYTTELAKGPFPEMVTIDFDCVNCNTRGIMTVVGKPSLDENIEVTVTTSAVNNEVDFKKPLSELAPFAVFAKIQKDGKPVIGLTEISAFLTSSDGQSVEVPLHDNGLGVPDVAVGDGIYSTLIVPNADGIYHISVVVKSQTQKNSQFGSELSGSIRLLPINQDEIGQRETVVLDKRFSSVFDFNGQIHFVNTADYTKQYQPSKILDLYASVSQTNKEVIILTFTSPFLLGGVNPSTKYIVQGARVLETLFTGSPEIREIIEVFEISPPLTKETIRIFNPIGSNSLTYFRILAIYEPVPSGYENSQTSNIVRVMPPVIDTTVPTTEPTTAEPTTEPNTEPTTTPIKSTNQPTTECTGPGCTDAPTSTEPTSSSTVPPGPQNPEETENEPFFETAGGIVVIIVIVLIVVGGAGGGYWYYRKRQSASSKNNV